MKGGFGSVVGLAALALLTGSAGSCLAGDTTGIDLRLPAAPAGHTISGRITRVDGGTPVIGAQVGIWENGAIVEQHDDRTDTHGRYRLAGVPDGSWFLRVQQTRTVEGRDA